MKMYDATGNKKPKGRATKGAYMGPGVPKAMPRKRPTKAASTVKATRPRKKMM